MAPVVSVPPELSASRPRPAPWDCLLPGVGAASSAAAWFGQRLALVRIPVTAEHGLGSRDPLRDLRERVAAGLEEQLPEVAVGVLGREHGAGVVVGPRQPPEVAVLAAARAGSRAR